MRSTSAQEDERWGVEIWRRVFKELRDKPLQMGLCTNRRLVQQFTRSHAQFICVALFNRTTTEHRALQHCLAFPFPTTLFSILGIPFLPQFLSDQKFTSLHRDLLSTKCHMPPILPPWKSFTPIPHQNDTRAIKYANPTLPPHPHPQLPKKHKLSPKPRPRPKGYW